MLDLLYFTKRKRVSNLIIEAANPLVNFELVLNNNTMTQQFGGIEV